MTISIPASRKKRKMHPNSLKNLEATKYKPGQNGNPKPGQSLKARLLNVLADNPKMVEDIVLSTIEGAIKRESVPFKELWDRVDGKVPGDTPPPTNINVVFVIGRGYRELGGNDATE